MTQQSVNDATPGQGGQHRSFLCSENEQIRLLRLRLKENLVDWIARDDQVFGDNLAAQRLRHQRPQIGFKLLDGAAHRSTAVALNNVKHDQPGSVVGCYFCSQRQPAQRRARSARWPARWSLPRIPGRPGRRPPARWCKPELRRGARLLLPPSPPESCRMRSRTAGPNHDAVDLLSRAHSRISCGASPWCTTISQSTPAARARSANGSRWSNLGAGRGRVIVVTNTAGLGGRDHQRVVCVEDDQAALGVPGLCQGETEDPFIHGKFSREKDAGGMTPAAIN